MAEAVAVDAALQAVDGVALKVVVDRRTSATGEARVFAFEAAFAVSQIEDGLPGGVGTVAAGTESSASGPS